MTKHFRLFPILCLVFYTILIGPLEVFSEEKSVEPVEESLDLVTFRGEKADQQDQWVTIDDGVFFGRSKTEFEVDPKEGIAKFYGNVSLKWGGGWCSVRRRPLEEPMDLSGYDAIQIVVKGDGKTYGIDLRHDEKRNGVYYEASFATIPSQWQTITLPFDQFEPLYLGKPKEGADPLDLTRIYNYAFVIANKQKGHYNLEIKSIQAIKKSQSDSHSETNK